MGAFSSNKKRQMENIDTTCINVNLDVKEFPSKSVPLGFHSRSFEGVSIYVCEMLCVLSHMACKYAFSSCLLPPHQPNSVCFLYRTLIEKSTVDRLVLLVTVSQEDVQLHYGVQGGQTRSLSVKTAGHISIGQWTHVALQVGGLLLLSWSSGGHLHLSRVPFKIA